MNFRTPIKKNTTATAGIMIKNNNSAPSLADEKMVFINFVFGVNLGRSSKITFLVSR